MGALRGCPRWKGWTKTVGLSPGEGFPLPDKKGGFDTAYGLLNHRVKKEVEYGTEIIQYYGT